MASSRKSEMGLSAMVVVVVVLLLQVLLVNGNDPKECNFEADPSCPQMPTGSLGHIVLVHGAGQGQWYWYMVQPMLEAAGYFVTTVQLGPSVTMARDSIENVTFWSYSQPLFDLLKCIDHKVLLVGHSAGGLTIAVAMEYYPKKVHAGVFVAAYMPDTAHNVSYVLDMGNKYSQYWEDTCIATSGNETWYYFGDRFLTRRLYQMCSAQVVTLMYTQKRPGSFFNNELAEVQLTNESYGSIDRFYIVTRDDLAVYTEFQLEMIANFPVKERKIIRRSGHEVMLSRPVELTASISDIARQYSTYLENADAAGDATWVEMKAKLNSIRRSLWHA